MVSEIRSLVERQSVVCISGGYLGKDDEGMNWVIDRVKTTTGEWSWFERGPNEHVGTDDK